MLKRKKKISEEFYEDVYWFQNPTLKYSSESGLVGEDADMFIIEEFENLDMTCKVSLEENCVSIDTEQENEILPIFSKELLLRTTPYILELCEEERRDNLMMLLWGAMNISKELNKTFVNKFVKKFKWKDADVDTILFMETGRWEAFRKLIIYCLSNEVVDLTKLTEILNYMIVLFKQVPEDDKMFLQGQVLSDFYTEIRDEVMMYNYPLLYHPAVD